MYSPSWGQSEVSELTKGIRESRLLWNCVVEPLKVDLIFSKWGKERRLSGHERRCGGLGLFHCTEALLSFCPSAGYYRLQSRAAKRCTFDRKTAASCRCFHRFVPLEFCETANRSGPSCRMIAPLVAMVMFITSFAPENTSSLVSAVPCLQRCQQTFLWQPKRRLKPRQNSEN